MKRLSVTHNSCVVHLNILLSKIKGTVSWYYVVESPLRAETYFEVAGEGKVHVIK